MRYSIDFNNATGGRKRCSGVKRGHRGARGYNNVDLLSGRFDAGIIHISVGGSRYGSYGSGVSQWSPGEALSNDSRPGSDFFAVEEPSEVGLCGIKLK